MVPIDIEKADEMEDAEDVRPPSLPDQRINDNEGHCPSFALSGRSKSILIIYLIRLAARLRILQINIDERSKAEFYKHAHCDVEDV